MSIHEVCLRRISESIPVMLGYCDSDQRFQYANRAYLEWNKISLDQLIGLTISEALGKTRYDKIADKVAGALSGNSMQFVVEQPLENGETHWVQANYIPDIDDHGKVLGFCLAVQDISEQLWAGINVKPLFQEVFEHGPMGVVLVDSEFRFISVNARFCEMLRYEESEIIGKSFLEFTHPDDRDLGADKSKEIFAGDQRFFQLEKRYISKSGDVIEAVTTASSIPGRENKGTTAIAVIEDVTEKKQTADRLRQSQRVAAIGELSGGLAHDFNNLLSIILGNLDLVSEKLESYPDANQECHKLLKSITSAAERGAAVTHRLLAFSRKQPLEPEVVDLNSVLAHMDQLIRHSLVENIDVEVIQSPGLWRCEIDRPQVENALVNLVVNARDAISNAGKITIETANTMLDDEYVLGRDDLISGQYVMLAVTDTGSGMTDDVILRSIEPFFTTKDLNQGSGLGLSMVYGFVKQSGGHISIYSEVDDGTTIKLYLPRTLINESHNKQYNPDKQFIDGDGQTVLLVEDDSDLRIMTASLLTNMGYIVHQAENGLIALKLFSNLKQVDLLLTDVMLPGDLTGRDIAVELISSHPELKVLYMSGYTENSIVHNGRLDSDAILLQKPFRKDQLARKILQAFNE